MLKLENVVPALDPPQIVTGNAAVVSDKLVMNGKLVKIGENQALKVGFLYRPYAGFVENTYNKEWQQSAFTDISQTGEYSIELPIPGKGMEYEYRAVVVHPLITITGETKRVR